MISLCSRLDQFRRRMMGENVEKDTIETVGLQTADFSPRLSLTPLGKHDDAGSMMSEDEDAYHVVIDIQPPQPLVVKKTHSKLLTVDNYCANSLQTIVEVKEPEVVPELGHHDRHTNIVLDLPSIEKRKDRFSPSDDSSSDQHFSPSNSLSPPSRNEALSSQESLLSSSSSSSFSSTKSSKSKSKMVKSISRGHEYIKPLKFRWDRNQLLLSYVSAQGHYWPDMNDNMKGQEFSSVFGVLSNLRSPAAVACA